MLEALLYGRLVLIPRDTYQFGEIDEGLLGRSPLSEAPRLIQWGMGVCNRWDLPSAPLLLYDTRTRYVLALVKHLLSSLMCGLRGAIGIS